VIPYEGATDGRKLYKEAHLMLAAAAWQANQCKKAIAEINNARQWPERLGVGKPYEEDIDERLEYFLLYQCYTKLNDKKRAADALEQIKQSRENVYAINNSITAWANGNTADLEKLPAPAINDNNGRILAAWLKTK
jgi:hypothetical protein